MKKEFVESMISLADSDARRTGKRQSVKFEKLADGASHVVLSDAKKK